MAELLILLQQVANQVGDGDQAHQLASIDNRKGVELARDEGFGGLANGAVLGEGDQLGLHDVFDFEAMVQRGIDGALVT